VTHRIQSHTAPARRIVIAAASLVLAGAASSIQAASGTWNANSDGTWSDSTKWLSGQVADGATFTATFEADLTSNRTVNLDTSRTIGKRLRVVSTFQFGLE